MTTNVSSIPSLEISTTQPVHTKLWKFSSEHLFYRPLLDQDLPAYHAMYKKELDSDSEMSTNSESTFKDWFNETQENFARVGIFIKNSDGTEGKFIGEGGVWLLENRYSKWPEIFYILQEEFWGKGYATEFVKEFLGIWWSLPRKDARIHVQPISLRITETSQVKEQLGAETKMSNKASVRILEKTGFELCGEYLQGKERYGYWRYLSPNK